MKLWLIRPVDGLGEKDDPWEPWFDKSFGFVVRAETEDRARQIANANGDDEVCSKYTQPRPLKCDPWLHERYSTCTELTPDGGEDIIMKDFARA